MLFSPGFAWQKPELDRFCYCFFCIWRDGNPDLNWGTVSPYVLIYLTPKVCCLFCFSRGVYRRFAWFPSKRRLYMICVIHSIICVNCLLNTADYGEHHSPRQQRACSCRRCLRLRSSVDQCIKSATIGHITRCIQPTLLSPNGSKGHRVTRHNIFHGDMYMLRLNAKAERPIYKGIMHDPFPPKRRIKKTSVVSLSQSQMQQRNDQTPESYEHNQTGKCW